MSEIDTSPKGKIIGELMAEHELLATKLAKAERERDEARRAADRAELVLGESLADLTAAQAALAQLREENEWREIKSAPTDGYFLGWNPSFYKITYWRAEVFRSAMNTVGHSLKAEASLTTRWQPAPAPPSEKSA